MNERLANLIPKPEIPPKPERPDVITASYLLPYFKWYVMKDPDRKNVSWEQLFGENRPSYLDPNVSYKSRRHIEIKEKVEVKGKGKKDAPKFKERDAFRVVAETIVLEDEAREGFNTQDPQPHLMFRLTLVKPGYKVDPRRPIDPENMFARAYVDLGPEGATILDSGDDQTLGYLRRFYVGKPYSQVDLIERLSPLQEEYPIVRFFTEPNRHRLRDDQSGRLSMDHLRTIYDTFLPTEPQDNKAA